MSPRPSPQPEAAISASELERLSQISTRLAALNEKLKIELEASNRSSSELASSLEISTRELATLRAELEASRRNSSELVERVGSSELESNALREALTRADASLKSLEESFGAYRREAEARILALGFGRIGLGLLAASGWVAAILALALR